MTILWLAAQQMCCCHEYGNSIQFEEGLTAWVEARLVVIQINNSSLHNICGSKVIANNVPLC